jgi:NitT/TauT family transport system ATP-binding protein
MVYPFSCHNYELRYWLAASGIDPDHEVQLVVIPPPLLVDALREGQIDGFCVGEPWNSLAVEAGVGTIVNSTSQIWRLSPEKVLGCRADWARQHPQQVAGMIRAIYRAAQWCDQPENHGALASMLAKPRYIGAPVDVLQRALGCKLRFAANTELVVVPEFFIMHGQLANFPWASHALWFYSQMVRWKQSGYSASSLETVRATYRPDLYRSALLLVDESIPKTDYKTERAVAGRYVVNDSTSSLTLSPEGFFDGRVFEPTDVEGYIKSFD